MYACDINTTHNFLQELPKYSNNLQISTRIAKHTANILIEKSAKHVKIFYITLDIIFSRPTRFGY